MRLYEFEGKKLLQQNGIPVPRGQLATSPEEAAVAAAALGDRAVVKAQLLVGGRGKAGLVKLVSGRREAADTAARILESSLGGQRVQSVLVEEQLSISRELYVSLSVDRLAGCPLILACAEGGVEIEEVARTRPEAVIRHHVDVLRGLRGYEAIQVAKRAGLEGDEAAAFARFLQKLYTAFCQMDAHLLEVNPLVFTTAGDLLAADAKVIVDDDAAFRQPFLRERRQEPGLTELEREGRQKKVSYVDLDGDVAIMGNGAGLVLSLLDLVRHYGATPANFLDTGGGASRTKAKDALTLVMKKAEQDPKVKSILLAFSLSISLPEDAAGGVLDAVAEMKPRVPIFAVVHGTRAEVGEEMLRSVGISTFRSIQEATRAAATARARTED
ncbi:MAG: succinate--CoA ligase subunit beta [Sphingomonadaceae bacterium]